ncbi:hypothetical protein Pan189_38770 [Stratiformator vulcanicus]|uniref:Uncharacterized protein n=1 Tax=Stratiformator vulcanicus TaxID=2527980 RepID=A0A517R6G1_9PLAN|nr:hypothetical protein Pan189_38770 [Stratiformator vulcanicus]
MQELCLFFVSVLIAELLCRIPMGRRVARIGSVARRSSRVIVSSRVSDHWKERAILRYSAQLSVDTTVIALWFVMVAGAVIGFDRLCAFGLRFSLFDYALTFGGLMLATGSSTLWLIARRFVVR